VWREFVGYPEIILSKPEVGVNKTLTDWRRGTRHVMATTTDPFIALTTNQVRRLGYTQ
jgi:hypothetical protein